MKMRYKKDLIKQEEQEKDKKKGNENQTIAQSPSTTTKENKTNHKSLPQFHQTANMASQRNTKRIIERAVEEEEDGYGTYDQRDEKRNITSQAKPIREMTAAGGNRVPGGKRSSFLRPDIATPTTASRTT